MTYSVDARKNISRQGLLRPLATAIVALTAAVSAGTARAQVYFEPYVQTYHWRGPAQASGARFISRREVGAILNEEGYRLAGPIDYRDDAIVVVGVDDYGRCMSFTIDRSDGEVVEARRLGPWQAARADFDNQGPAADQSRASRPQDRRTEISEPTRRENRPSEASPPPAPRVLERKPSQPTRPAAAREPKHAEGWTGWAGQSPREREQPAAPLARSATHPPAIQSTAPSPASPATMKSEIPDAPRASSAATAQGAASRQTKTPVAAAHGSTHRAIVPPPEAARAAPSTAPVLGSTTAPAPGAPDSIVVKPAGG